MTIDDLDEAMHEYVSSRTDKVSYEDMKSRLHDLVDICLDHFTWLNEADK